MQLAADADADADADARPRKRGRCFFGRRCFLCSRRAPSAEAPAGVGGALGGVAAKPARSGQRVADFGMAVGSVGVNLSGRTPPPMLLVTSACASVALLLGGAMLRALKDFWPAAVGFMLSPLFT